MANHRELIVWQRAHENLLAILQAIERLPRRAAVLEVIRQLVRSASSIGANIAEGQGRQMLRRRIADYRNFFEIALGSSMETDNWLRVIQDAGWLASEIVEPLLRSNEEVMKMLYAMLEHQHDRILQSTV